LRGRWKGGTARNALGRSRGGFSTKINARTNADGLPIGIEITPGQTHDVTAYPALMDDIDCDPEQMLGDKGYDSEAVRRDIGQRGGEAVIPSLASRKIQHAVDKAVYALRNRIERFFNRAKNSRRVATRYDKLIESFAAFVLLACIRIWIRFVHATYPGASDIYDIAHSLQQFRPAIRVDSGGRFPCDGVLPKPHRRSDHLADRFLVFLRRVGVAAAQGIGRTVHTHRAPLVV
jgi:transposase